jgi:uncharacterized membrane protein YozB (DUF420 family)
MLDLLLIPAALLVLLALRAVRRGEHRQHGYYMIAAFTLVGLRLLLHPRDLTRLHSIIWMLTLAVAAVTVLLGRFALAWREGRSARAGIPRLHRALGAITLVGLALTTLVWLMRSRV